MARKIGLLTLLLALSTALQLIAQDAGRYDSLVNDNNEFAFKFFRQSLAQTSESNVLVAPTALSADFAFLQNGAESKTRAEILETFDLKNLSADEINQQSFALRKALTCRRHLRNTCRARE